MISFLPYSKKRSSPASWKLPVRTHPEKMTIRKMKRKRMIWQKFHRLSWLKMKMTNGGNGNKNSSHLRAWKPMTHLNSWIVWSKFTSICRNLPNIFCNLKMMINLALSYKIWRCSSERCLLVTNSSTMLRSSWILSLIKMANR